MTDELEWLKTEPTPTLPPTLPELVRAALTQVGDLVIAKNHDYGTRNISDTPFGNKQSEVVRAVLVRLNDKVKRMANLAGSGKDYVPNYESALDTAFDIIGYGVILSMVLDGNWPGVDSDG